MLTQRQSQCPTPRPCAKGTGTQGRIWGFVLEHIGVVGLKRTWQDDNTTARSPKELYFIVSVGMSASGLRLTHLGQGHHELPEGKPFKIQGYTCCHNAKANAQPQGPAPRSRAPRGESWGLC